MLHAKKIFFCSWPPNCWAVQFTRHTRLVKVNKLRQHCHTTQQPHQKAMSAWRLWVACDFCTVLRKEGSDDLRCRRGLEFCLCSRCQKHLIT